MDRCPPLRLTAIARELLFLLFSIGFLILAGVLPSGSAQAQSAVEAARPGPGVAPSLAELIERADRDALHESPQWLALVHYERQWWRPGFHSRAATEAFFLSERGDRDPRAELHATLRALIDPDSETEEDERIACRFVARRYWLAARLDPGGKALPVPSCPRYTAWRAGLGARGLSLIFPEGFMSNPASVFGHTLLRIDVERQAGPGEIAGWAVDFTAETGDDGGLVYMARGVFGVYAGRFGARPYYEQLKRYSDWENRDIWEYRLDVGDDELELLLMHLWELDDVTFPYFFFTKNCSYELLRLLEVGIPELSASAGFRGPVIPIDTVRAVAAHPGLVESARYRASPETELRAALASLSRNERARVEDIVTGRVDPSGVALDELPVEARARVLDVAYDQLRYQYLTGTVTEEESRGLARRILIARSRLPSRAPGEGPPAPIEPETRPDQGHASSVVSLSAGWRDDESYVDIRWRPAFHDMMDRAGGHLAEMEVRMLDTRLRVYPESGRVRLQELTFFELASLSPRSRVFTPWAWRAGTGLRTRRVSDDGDLDDVLVWGTHIGAGLAWDPHWAVLAYALAGARLEVGSRLEHNVGLGPAARLGLYLGPAESRLRGHLFGEVTYFAVGDTTTRVRAGGELRISTSRNTALHLDVSANRSYSDSWIEAGLRMSLYF
jgi:hypothetical protein